MTICAEMFQVPFSPKDWSNSIPAWLLAFGFLVGIGVYAAKQLGLVKQPGDNGKREPSSGELKPEVWHRRFDDLEKCIDEAKEEHMIALRDLTKAVNELTMTLLRGK